MRSVEIKMNEALRNGKNFKSRNTTVTWTDGVATVRLHDNIIAMVDTNTGEARLSNCGYHTSTTRSRLNALTNVLTPSYGFRIKNFEMQYTADDCETWNDMDLATPVFKHCLNQ